MISFLLWYSGLKQFPIIPICILKINKTVKNQPFKPLCSALLESINISALLHSCPTWTLVPPLRELPKPLVICPKHLFYQLESCPAPFGNLSNPTEQLSTPGKSPSSLDFSPLTWTFVSPHPDSCHPPGYLTLPSQTGHR